MAKENSKQLVKRSVFEENQVLAQILGICSALAVSNSMKNALVMGIGVIFTTGLSSMTLSAMRAYIPHRVRMIIQTLVIAVYVILVDILLQAFLPDISKQLGPYVGLIITNCIVMGRAEAYAAQNPPFQALLDGAFSGVGYTLVLLFVAFIRELLGFGTLFGYRVMPETFETWTIMIMAPSAFFIIGTLIWFVKARKEKNEALQEAAKTGNKGGVQ